MNKKKLLALLMALVMTLTLVPVTAFADGNVAKIDDAEYATLAEAISAAQSGATITLIGNVTHDNPITLYKDLILDLNGQTLTMNVTSGMNGAVKLNGHSLTIQDNSEGQNGLMDITSSSGNAAYAFYVSGSGSSLTIESGNVVAKNAVAADFWSAKGIQAVTVSSGSTFTMTGGSLTASNANYSGKAAYVVYLDGGTANISDGAIFCDDRDTNGWSQDHLVYKSSGTANITGGKFKSPKALDYTGVANKLTDAYELAAEDADGYRPVVSKPTYVAQIGENNKFASLAEAIAAVPDNTETTITMIGDSVETGRITINNDQNIVLDLAGHTVSYTEAAPDKSVYFLTNKGILTIQDSGGNGEIVFTADPYASNYSKEYVTIYNLDGTLNLVSGKITNDTAGGLGYAVNNSSNAWGKGDNKETVFNMSGGIVSAPHGDAAIRIYQNCADVVDPVSHNTLNITGGTVLDTGIFVDNNIYQGTANTTGENILIDLNISGGTINGLIDLKLRHTFNTSLDITGGDFTNAKLRVRKQTDSVHIWNVQGEPTEPIVTISGGKWSFASSANAAFNVSSGWTTTSSWTNYQPYSVTGGVFNVDLNAVNTSLNSIVFPEGKTGVANTDSSTSEAYPYTVGVPAPTYVAQIGEGENAPQFATLDEAIGAAQAGDTVKLLQNITYGTDREVPVWNKAVNLNLNGHILTTNSGVGKNLSNMGYTAAAVCYSIPAASAGNVTISNGTIVTAYGAGVYADDPGLTLTLENVTINAGTVGVQSTPEYTSAVRITGGAKVIINSGSYSSDANALTVSNSGGEFVVNDGTFSGKVFSSYDNATAKIITINGGKFSGTFEKTTGTITINGGVFTNDAKTSAESVATLGEGKSWTNNSDSNTSANYPYTVGVEAQPVAEVNGTQYTTLAAAIQAANISADANVTITLLADCEVGSEYTVTNPLKLTKAYAELNLNGCTVTQNNNFSFVIQADNAIIRNGNIYSGANTAKNTGYNSYGLVINNCDGVLIDGVHVTGGISVGGSNGETPEAGAATNVILRNSSALSGDFYAVCAQFNSTLTIESGSYSKASQGTGVIQGTFVGNDGPKGTVTVTGGEFKGGIINNNSGDIVLKGGVFSVSPAEKYLAEGYQVISSGLSAYPYQVGRIVENAIEATTNDESDSITPVVVTNSVSSKTVVITPVADVTNNTNKGKETKITQSALQQAVAAISEADNKEVKIITGLSATQQVGGAAAPQTVITDTNGDVIFAAEAKGGQLRMDKKVSNGGGYHGAYNNGASTKAEAIDYVDLRLQFKITLPDGVSPSDLTTKWSWTLKYGNVEKTVNGVNYLPVSGEANTYTSNVVVTNIPLSSCKDMNFSATLTISYEVGGVTYTITQSSEVPLTRHISDLVEYYISDANINESAKEYAYQLKQIYTSTNS